MSSSTSALLPRDRAIESATAREVATTCGLGTAGAVVPDPAGATLRPGPLGPPGSLGLASQTMSWFVGRFPPLSVWSWACCAAAVTAIVAAMPMARPAAASAAPERAW